MHLAVAPYTRTENGKLDTINYCFKVHSLKTQHWGSVNVTNPKTRTKAKLHTYAYTQPISGPIGKKCTDGTGIPACKNCDT